MAKILSFASWNVEHFHGDPERVERVVDLIRHVNPDLFALYEVKGKSVFDQLKTKLSTHNFAITERTDASTMEILIGFRRNLSVFITQRDEFRSKLPTLRPGMLATVTKGNADYSFLFLHLKSFSDPRSWGLRDDMFMHAASLKRALDKRASPGKAKFMVLGDFNTMGLNAPFNEISDLLGEQEITSITKRFNRVSMRPLLKTHEMSWWNATDKYAPGSKLDHVYADKNLKFKAFDGSAEIKVIGWPQEDTVSKQKRWIEKYSDHALLYGEIHS